MLPPELFPTDLQPLIYFTLLPMAILFGIAVVIIFYIFFIPSEAKTHIWYRFKKLPLMDYETNEGLRILEPMKSYGNGINVGTKTGNSYIIPQPISMNTILMELQPQLEQIEKDMKTKNPKVNPEAIKAKQAELVEEEIKEIRKMERVTLSTSSCKGSGAPIWRSYGSKAIGVKLAHLVGLSYEADNTETRLAIPLSVKTGKRLEPAKLFFENGKPTTDQWTMPVSLPVNPSIVKKWFPKMWNPAQIAALKQIHEEIGRKGAEKNQKQLIMIMAFMAGMVILAVVVGLIMSG